jgi:inorganic pyrophosphatase
VITDHWSNSLLIAHEMLLFVRTSCKRAYSTAFPPPLYATNPENRVISYWHDVPLHLSQTSSPAEFTFVNEIPRHSHRKFEISTRLENNPVVQDSDKNGLPRDYKLDSLVNYGAIPQTWEDPYHVDVWTKLNGDGDPLDVCEIGSAVAKTGDIYTVKILGALAMIDGGETDWKLLAIRADDPLAPSIQDVTLSTTPDKFKRVADQVRHWFRVYKVPEGKPENEFAFQGAWLDVGTSLDIIQAHHEQWKALITGRPVQDSSKKAPWTNIPTKGIPETIAKSIKGYSYSTAYKR